MSANEQTTRSRGKKAATAPEPTTTISEAGKQLKPTDFIQLFNKKTGEVLWQTNIPKVTEGFHFHQLREKQFIECLPQILRDMHEADIDISLLTLADTNLAGALLSHCDLAGADLSNCNFNNADLRHANLRGCDLHDSVFDGTRMTGADITDANLDDVNLGHTDSRYVIGLILLDELNDYFVWAYPRGKEKFLRIRAGCRDFSLQEAREHWSYDEKGTKPAAGREEIFAALPLIEVMARRMDWAITVEQAEERYKAANPKTATDEEEDDDALMDGESEE